MQLRLFKKVEHKRAVLSMALVGLLAVLANTIAAPFIDQGKYKPNCASIDSEYHLSFEIFSDLQEAGQDIVVALLLQRFRDIDFNATSSLQETGQRVLLAATPKILHGRSPPSA